jgi:hypothetical protein
MLKFIITIGLVASTLPSFAGIGRIDLSTLNGYELLKMHCVKADGSKREIQESKNTGYISVERIARWDKISDRVEYVNSKDGEGTLTIKNDKRDCESSGLEDLVLTLRDISKLSPVQLSEKEDRFRRAEPRNRDPEDD